MRVKPAESIAEVIINNKFIFEHMQRDFSKNKKPKKIVYEYTEITIESPNKVDARV